MGYRLTKTFLDAYCTGREPGPEWLTLLRLCEDAPNDTAVCAPGWAELAGGRHRTTVVRHLATLERQGWIETVSKAAPGRRARYRIFPNHYQPEANQRDASVRHDGRSDVMHEPGRRDARTGPTWRTLHASRSEERRKALSSVDITGSVADSPGAAQNGSGAAPEPSPCGPCPECGSADVWRTNLDRERICVACRWREGIITEDQDPWAGDPFWSDQDRRA